MGFSWGIVAAANPCAVQAQVDFSRDGSLIATCGDRVRVFEVESGRLLREIEGPATLSIAFSPSVRDLLAVGATDGTIRLWQVGHPDMVRELKGNGPVGSLEFNADGRFLASGAPGVEGGARDNGQFRLWEVETGNLVKSLDFKNAWIDGVTFSSDGQLVAFCRNLQPEGGTVEVYNVRSAKSIASITLSVGKMKDNPYGAVTPFGRITRFIPGAQQLVVAGGVGVPLSPEQVAPYKTGCQCTGLLWIADVNAPDSARLLVQPRSGYHRCLDLSPDGKRFAIDTGHPPSPNYQRVELREIGDGKRVWNIPGGGDSLSPVFGLRFSPDGKLIAAGVRDKLRLIDAETGRIVRIASEWTK